MAHSLDPYRSLGVSRSATDAEIKAAYRRLAKRYHPDASKGDTVLFLQVQEAYRVLSDPLLRRDWDARHAPGPLRADRPVEPTQAGRRPQSSREKPSARRTKKGRSTDDAAAASDASDEARQPGPGQPRSSRSYTWSAGDVPWWEEGVQRQARRPPRRKRTTREARDATPPTDRGPEAPRDFDVYNRSSGAAWSMAARAYFRRGDQDLPSRGSFRHQGTQPLTAARARAAAEAEARSQTATRPPVAAAPPPPGRPAAAAGAAFKWPAAGVARDAQRIQRVRDSVRRRALAETWPSIRERMLYALLAWIPVAMLIGYGGATATGCDRAALGCPAYLETVQAVLIALALGGLVALPKVAYVGAMASLGALLIGLAAVGLLAFAGVRPPLSTEITVAFAAALLVAYVVTAALVLIRGSGSQPWSAGSRG